VPLRSARSASARSLGPSSFQLPTGTTPAFARILMNSFQTLGALAVIATPALAQGPSLQSPGIPLGAQLSQTTRFSNEFNPAIGFVFDILGSYTDVDEGRDGFDIELRSLELTAAAYVDPNAWAYAVLVGEPGEGVEVEEAAVRYLGLPGNHTLQAGRFFVDFGKQMQAHVHDLRTVERPAVLREYLGTELAGTGLQYDNWIPVGDKSVLRYSLGVFQSLLSEGHGHGDEDEEDGIEARLEGRRSASELSWTGRLTGMRDIGERGTLQVGVSTRWIPNFEYAFEGLDEATDNETWVWGVDATYGWKDAQGNRSFTVGGEYLIFDGDIRAEFDDDLNPTQILVEDDTVRGFYLWADHGWTPRDFVGLQWSHVELPEHAGEELDEFDLYYTRFLTEFQRLRFAVTLRDSDDDQEVRFAIQYTNYIGPHSHGINW
jgi:hypothetical protein